MAKTDHARPPRRPLDERTRAALDRRFSGAAGRHPLKQQKGTRRARLDRAIREAS